MISSTLPIAICLVLLIYCLIMHRLGWRWLSYALTVFVAVVCLRQKTVHFEYIGIEVAALGCLLTYIDPLKFVRQRAGVRAPSSEASKPA